MDSVPLVETVPFEQEKVCWNVLVPLEIPTVTVEFAVVPWLKAGTEYVRPLTVWFVVEQLAAAVWTAVQVHDGNHP